MTTMDAAMNQALAIEAQQTDRLLEARYLGSTYLMVVESVMCGLFSGLYARGLEVSFDALGRPQLTEIEIDLEKVQGVVVRGPIPEDVREAVEDWKRAADGSAA